MADKSSELILEGLSRALAEPAGLPLFGGTKRPGLFAATAPAKRAAGLCKEQGLLQAVRTESKGRTSVEFCALTEKGLAHLLAEVSPRVALEALVAAVEARAGQLGDLLAAARHAHDSLETIKRSAEKMLRHFHDAGPSALSGARRNGCADDEWVGAALDHLARWQIAHTLQDCPLPHLYQQARKTSPALSIGQFHDGLRRLYEQQRVYLHPWTGPLYEIPEPALALMIGHEVLYYASIRA